MEITEAARATRASAPLTPLDPPDAAPARAAFGVVLLHIAFFAVGAVMLLVGFAAAAAQRLASALRHVRGPVAARGTAGPTGVAADRYAGPTRAVEPRS